MPHSRWTSFLANRIKPSCQPTTIGVGSTFITTNNALAYIITSVENEDATLPSLVYLNNPLGRCGVSKVTLLLDLMDRSAAQMSVSPWGVELRGETSCTVDVDIGSVRVNMTALWNLYPDHTRYGGDARFIGRNETSRASLFWGESLLSNFEVRLQDQLWQNNENGHWKKATKVEWGFVRGQSETDITNINYYNSSARNFGVQPSGFGKYSIGTWPPPEQKYLTNLSDFGKTIYAPLVSTVDGLAKSFNSTILTDLGQNDSQPNILTGPKLLQHFTANFTSMLATKDRSYGEAGPALKSYEELIQDSSSRIGVLGVNATTIASSYICNVPQRTPWPELLIAILVADLVFMRTLWSVFTLSFGQWMAKDDVKSNWCEGCVNSVGDHIKSGAHSIPLMIVANHPFL